MKTNQDFKTLNDVIENLLKKNSQLHVVIEMHKLNRLKEEAKEQGVSLAELCRQKLKP